jgi:hypothetical protein
MKLLKHLLLSTLILLIVCQVEHTRSSPDGFGEYTAELHKDSLWDNVIFDDKYLRLTYKEKRPLKLYGEYDMNHQIKKAYCKGNPLTCEIPYKSKVKNKQTKKQKPIIDVVRFSNVGDWYRIVIEFQAKAGDQKGTIPIRLVSPGQDIGAYLAKVINFEKELVSKIKVEHLIEIPLPWKINDKDMGFRMTKEQFSFSNMVPINMDKLEHLKLEEIEADVYKAEIIYEVENGDKILEGTVQIENGYLDIIKDFFDLIGKKELFIVQELKKMKRYHLKKLF